MTDLPELAKSILEDLAGLVEKAKQITSFGPEAISVIWEIVVEVITAIEKYSSEVEHLTSHEKRSIAAQSLNALIDIPWVPEWMEAKVFDFAVDGAIQLFNSILGNSWLKVKLEP